VLGNLACQQRQPSHRPHHQLLPRRAPPAIAYGFVLNLRGMISQRLMPKKDSKGRAAAVEIMLNTPLISELIFKGETRNQRNHEKKPRIWHANF
jgi:twitching motility protein PilU